MALNGPRVGRLNRGSSDRRPYLQCLKETKSSSSPTRPKSVRATLVISARNSDQDCGARRRASSPSRRHALDGPSTRPARDTHSSPGCRPGRECEGASVGLPYSLPARARFGRRDRVVRTPGEPARRRGRRSVPARHHGNAAPRSARKELPETSLKTPDLAIRRTAPHVSHEPLTASGRGLRIGATTEEELAAKEVAGEEVCEFST